MQELRTRRKEQGLCVYCGGELDKEGIYCSECTGKTNKMKHDWVLERHNKGYCVNCNNLMDRENGWFCIECAKKLNTRAKIRNAYRKANHLCIQCGESSDDYSYCQRCRDMRMERYWRKKNKK